jgi:hypothetical protein
LIRSIDIVLWEYLEQSWEQDFEVVVLVMHNEIVFDLLEKED